MTEHLLVALQIPSLCLHMQRDTEKDPFVDWKSWWNEYDLEKLKSYV